MEAASDRLSDDCCRALSLLGATDLAWDPRPTRAPIARCRLAARRARAADAPGRILLLTGPSGSGKSLTLRLAKRLWRERSRRVIDGARPLARTDARLIDALGAHPVHRRLRALACAGLSEAPVLMRPVGVLSVGQRARARIARAILAAERTPRDRAPVVVIDEFTGALDRVTARSVATSLARWARTDGRTLGVRLALATAHDDVEAWLRPDMMIRMDE